MGLFDFWDARKGIARWAARTRRHLTSVRPDLSEEQFVMMALAARYSQSPLHPRQQAILEVRARRARDIHGLCTAIAEAELLHDVDPSARLVRGSADHRLVEKTLQVIHDELEKLGFESEQSRRTREKNSQLQSLQNAGIQIGQSKSEVLAVMGRQPDVRENLFPEPGRLVEQWTFQEQGRDPVVVHFSKQRVSWISA